MRPPSDEAMRGSGLLLCCLNFGLTATAVAFRCGLSRSCAGMAAGLAHRIGPRLPLLHGQCLLSAVVIGASLAAEAAHIIQRLIAIPARAFWLESRIGGSDFRLRDGIRSQRPFVHEVCVMRHQLLLVPGSCDPMVIVVQDDLLGESLCFDEWQKASSWSARLSRADAK